MATDYSKLKVTELKELLTARSLPVSGKKEDLVARLVENDAANPTSTNDLLGDLAPPEEEYDWDTPATKASATKTEQQKPPAPAPAPRSAAAKPLTDSAVKPTQPEKPKSPPGPAPAAAPVDTDAEIAAEVERRRKRAERFGIPVSDSVKALERAKRFGATPETKPQTELSKTGAPRQRLGNQGELKDVQPTKPKITDDPAEAEKARKRAERFGGGNEGKKLKT